MADVIVLGIPFDLAATGRAGTRSGPWAVRQASANLVWEERRWPGRLWPWNTCTGERGASRAPGEDRHATGPRRTRAAV
ncbi:MAG: arginase family protein [Chromatiales bacterium]